jgi:hypothetical protein
VTALRQLLAVVALVGGVGAAFALGCSDSTTHPTALGECKSSFGCPPWSPTPPTSSGEGGGEGGGDGAGGGDGPGGDGAAPGDGAAGGDTTVTPDTSTPPIDASAG